MIDLDEEMERMQKMLDRRERMALGVTCTEMIWLITRLREAEKDAVRYRWIMKSADAKDLSEIFFADESERDEMVDEAMQCK